MIITLQQIKHLIFGRKLFYNLFFYFKNLKEYILNIRYVSHIYDKDSIIRDITHLWAMYRIYEIFLLDNSS